MVPYFESTALAPAIGKITNVQNDSKQSVFKHALRDQEQGIEGENEGRLECREMMMLVVPAKAGTHTALAFMHTMGSR